MIIKPLIRANVHISAHPAGIKKSVEDMVAWAKAQPKIEMTGKNVLIVGGSSGYGLGTRIALAFGAGANTINVSFERGPQGNMTGTAGWWNNIYFQEVAAKAGLSFKDFNGDAFSWETKKQVTEYIKETYGKIDLLVYSLASPVRQNPNTGELVKSALKPIGKNIKGTTIDIAKEQIMELEVEAATEQDIKDTVYVMGGEDWKMWVEFLLENDLLADGFKTISYTYIGAESMSDIYRGGTIGKAKEDLERTSVELNNLLKNKVNGESLISVSKAVATKASVFIPGMPTYGCILFDEMMKKGIHESVIAHKYRLYKDMVFGNARELDEQGRIRLDAWEMRKDIQDAVYENIKAYGNNPEVLFNLKGAKEFMGDFYKMNGFDIEGVDYEQDVDLAALGTIELK